jgi:hypothetical protein
MKTINGFDDCLQYVQHLGFGKVAKGPGWIPLAQGLLCDTCDNLLAASGQTSWYEKTFKPFRVRYTYDHDSQGQRYPVRRNRGQFTLVLQDGRKVNA